MALLRDFEPDLLVMDLMLPKTDGLSLIQNLRQMSRQPSILVQTSLTSPYVMERLQGLGVDYVMTKPCKMQALEVRVWDFLAQTQPFLPEQPVGDQMMAGVLISLGFSPKLDGYAYLTDAIPDFAQDPTQSITKELYATVGKLRRKDAALVERSIRSAIEKACRDGDPKIWAQYFPSGPDGRVSRPSNGAFIARMAQLLMGRMPKAAGL